MSTGVRDLAKKLYPLLPEERARLAAEEIWYFRVEGKIFGPYALKNLQAYLLAHTHYPDSTRIQNERDKKWISPHDSELFDRRKESSEHAHHQQDEGPYFLLVEGQKHGPHRLKEIQLLLGKKEILLTDYWSLSTRGPWKKIFEHPAFDRRKNELPPLPVMDDSDAIGAAESLDTPSNHYQDVSGLIDALSNRPTRTHSELSAQPSPLFRANPQGKNTRAPLSSQIKFYRTGLAIGVSLFILTAIGGVYKLFFQGPSFPEITEVEKKHRRPNGQPQNRMPAEGAQQGNHASTHAPAPPPPPPAPPPPPTYDPPDPEDQGGFQEEPLPQEDAYVEPPAEENPDREVASEDNSQSSDQTDATGEEGPPSPPEAMAEEAPPSEDVVE